MAEIDGEQYAARKLGCEISADPLNPLDPIKKVCKSHHPDEDLSILDRAYRRAVIQHSAQRRKSGEPYIIHPLAVSQILADLGIGPDRGGSRPVARHGGRHRLYVGSNAAPNSATPWPVWSMALPS